MIGEKSSVAGSGLLLETPKWAQWGRLSVDKNGTG